MTEYESLLAYDDRLCQQLNECEDEAEIERLSEEKAAVETILMYSRPKE